MITAAAIAAAVVIGALIGAGIFLAALEAEHFDERLNPF